MGEEPIENENIEVQGETPSDQTEKTTQEGRNFDALGMEFNAKVASIIEEFSDKLPIFFMQKIVQNISTDLILRQVSYQIQWAFQELEEKQKSRKIIL